MDPPIPPASNLYSMPSEYRITIPTELYTPFRTAIFPGYSKVCVPVLNPEPWDWMTASSMGVDGRDNKRYIGRRSDWKGGRGWFSRFCLDRRQGIRYSRQRKRTQE